MHKYALDSEVVEKLWSRKALEPFHLEDDLMRVDGFVMHKRCEDHVDELCALWTVQENQSYMEFPSFVSGWKVVLPDGAENFVEAANRIIYYSPKSKALPKGEEFRFLHTCGSDQEADEYVVEMRDRGKNIIPLGIGTAAPFNEHGQGAKGRMQNDCTTLRVARLCGADSEQAYKMLYKEIVRADAEATQRHSEIGRVIKRAHRLGFHFEYVARKAFDYFRESVLEGSRMAACASEFDKKRGKVSINGIQAGLITSNSPFAHTWLRSKGANIAVKITPGAGKQRKTLMQCGRGAESRRWFTEIAAEICRAECRKKRMSEDEVESWVAKTREMAESGAEGNMPGADNTWYMFELQLMNGSLSHDRDPTTLTYEEIVQCISLALQRVPSLGKAGAHFRDAEKQTRKAFELFADCGEGASAAAEANSEQILRHLTNAIQFVKNGRRGDVKTKLPESKNRQEIEDADTDEVAKAAVVEEPAQQEE